MAKVGVDHSRTMRIEMVGPAWLVSKVAGRLIGNHNREAIYDPDGQEAKWSCNIRNEVFDYSWTEPYGHVAHSESSPHDLASATFLVRIPPPKPPKVEPPKPDITTLIAKWRDTFAPADREALWKALSGKGGYILDGVRYLATQPCMGSDQRYSIEVS